MSLIILAAILHIVTIIFFYFKWVYQYWKRKNLPYLEPTIPFGHLANVIQGKEHLGLIIQKIYNETKRRNWKHAGIYFFTSPTYVPANLDYIKNILTKDFHHFVDRGAYVNEKDDPLSAHLFSIGGVKWRNLRTKLTPTFTSGKMKMMFQTLVDCEANLQKKMLVECEKEKPIDIKEVLGCFTTDVIGSCAFGLDCQTFEDENSPFRVHGKNVFQRTTSKALQIVFATVFPNFARKVGMKFFPEEISRFFMGVVESTVDYREKNNHTRKDFMQLLIDMKNNRMDEDGYNHDGQSLTMDELAAQCFVFFLAGFETSSTTMAFALYELAKHQDIQDKVRNEINTVLAKHGGKITYESIQDMKYMNQVIDETLRKYSPVPTIARKCVKDYKIPDEDVVIEAGTTVIIPILGIHHDPEYYPDPKKFDPERFSGENKSSRHHYAHIPFGEGPRICIGLRFGLMQSKVGLTSLLKTYKFTVNGKTQEPLKMQAKAAVLAAEGEIWLNAEKL